MTAAAWWSGRALGLDFETDGPEPEDARIIQFAITRIEPSQVEPATDSSIVQPEREIPTEALAVHGISTELARETGEPRAEAVAYIAALLGDARPDVPVVGHNLAYDLTLLDREMRRLGLGSLGIERNEFATLGMVTLRRDGVQVATFPVIDTMVLDKALDPYRKGPPGGGRNKLPETARVYGVKLGEAGAHDASADVIASLRIAWRIASMCRWPATRLAEHFADRKRPSELAIAFNGLADTTLPNLHLAQVKWAQMQAEGLRQHFMEHPEKGVDPAAVSGAWPFRPITTISTTERI